VKPAIEYCGGTEWGRLPHEQLVDPPATRRIQRQGDGTG
jgi:hypothetical protein